MPASAKIYKKRRRTLPSSATDSYGRVWLRNERAKGRNPSKVSRAVAALLLLRAAGVGDVRRSELADMLDAHYSTMARAEAVIEEVQMFLVEKGYDVRIFKL